MKAVEQNFEEILRSLSPLDVNWMDDKATAIMDRITSLSPTSEFTRTDIERLMTAKSGDEFEVSKFCVGLFLGYSKDKLAVELTQRLGKGGTGIKRFQKDKDKYLDVLEEMGLRDAVTTLTNMKPVWSDILKERLRSGRGSAVTGIQRGRGLEDWAESIVKDVFGDIYEARCTFRGPKEDAKCDFAIPNKNRPLILIECKGYGATGSKMTDIIGDLDAIIDAKRGNTSLLFVTDGLTWKARLNDLRKILERQHHGGITRIYTKQMQLQFEEDLRTLKSEYGL